MELTPIVPLERQVIERYGPTGFRVSGVVHKGSVIVFPDRVLAWEAAEPAGVSFEALMPVVEAGEVEILLIGLGRNFGLLPPALRARLRAAGIAVEAMDTGAACRTYNLLLSEGRRVAAALIAPV
ncbi:MAG TPA: Mth938-like domain-containing protein [Stellaceae bacterium]|nr:Mth938-like domain-containing protein [Stellaceae bacterium]